MNNDLAPTYQRLFGHSWVLWYSKSNTYSVVIPEFKQLLDTYLDSTSNSDFSKKLSLTADIGDLEDIVVNLKTYLRDCNKTASKILITKDSYKLSPANISKFYIINNLVIQIDFDSELVQQTIHPALAHLETEPIINADVCFSICLDKGNLNLFKNIELIVSVPKRDYHLVQGKFIFHLISSIHKKNESDWLGTIHGSAISDGANAILLIGNSGRGKSTLSALLAAHGFELLADDVSAILSQNRHIYFNPNAVSIKKGAFNILRSRIDNFNDLPNTNYNTSKGTLKYVPFPKPNNSHYPCKTIIMVNFRQGSKTQLEPIAIKTLFEVLISESWLSPNPLHAKQFLDWLEGLDFYQLTYSDNDNAINLVSDLFAGMSNN